MFKGDKPTPSFCLLVCICENDNQPCETSQHRKPTVETNLLNKIKNILVVNKLYVTPINFFTSVFFLFHLKNMLPNWEFAKQKS